MTAYPSHLSAHGPCRSLGDVRLELQGRRARLLLRQLEAETAGEDNVAADCQRQINDIDARLRAVEAAGGKWEFER